MIPIALPFLGGFAALIVAMAWLLRTPVSLFIWSTLGFAGMMIACAMQLPCYECIPGVFTAGLWVMAFAAIPMGLAERLANSRAGIYLLALLAVTLSACAPVTKTQAPPAPGLMVQVVYRPATPTPPAPPAMDCTVTAQALTVRAEANAEAQPLAWLKRGDAVQVEKPGAWVRTHGGFVNSLYLECEK